MDWMGGRTGTAAQHVSMQPALTHAHGPQCACRHTLLQTFSRTRTLCAPAAGPDRYGEDVSVLEMDGQFDKLEELIYVESHLSNTGAKFYGEVTQQMLKNSSFPGSNNGTGLFQSIIGLKVCARGWGGAGARRVAAVGGVALWPCAGLFRRSDLTRLPPPSCSPSPPNRCARCMSASPSSRCCP